MKKLFLLSCLLVTAAIAAETTSPNPLSWLDQQGIISPDEMTKALDAKFTPEDREKLDKAVLKRNSEIRKSNEEFALTLRELLKSDDAQIAQRIEKKSDSDKEAAKLALMKRQQPSRYTEYMRNKEKEQKKTP